MRVVILLVLCGAALAGPPSEARRLAFVRAWYRDVLGRPGSPAEHAEWARHLADHPVISIAHEFVRVGESQAIAYRRLAVRAYGAVTDAEVLAFANAVPPRRRVRTDARMKLITKPLPRDTAALRVNAAHLLALGRPATKVELESWGLAVAKGFLPIAVCHQLEQSDEGLAFRGGAIWRDLLGREPTQDELGHLLLNQRAGATEEDVMAQVLACPEYALRNRIPAE